MTTSIRILFFLSLAFSQLVDAQDLNENLLSNYLFTNNFQDESSIQFHGSSNYVSFTEDRFGTSQAASYYDGTACLEFPNNEILKPQFPFSIAVWVKPEVEFLRSEGIVGTDQFLDDYFGAFISILSNGKLMIGYGDGCGQTGSPCRVSEVSTRTFSNDEWYHIAAIFESGSNLELYINGCKEETTESGTGTENLAYSNEPGAVGKKDHSDIASNPIVYYHGTIDDFFYWDRAINVQDIAKLVDNYFQNGNSQIEYLGCQNDGYFVEVNGTIFNESNASGFEILTNQNGCDSIVSVNLEFLPNEDLYSIEYICDDPDYSIIINNNTFDINNPFGTEQIENINGCFSTHDIELIFSNSSFESIAYEGCEGDNYFVEVNDITYNEINPTRTQNLNNQNGCDSILEINLKFNSSSTAEYIDVI